MAFLDIFKRYSNSMNMFILPKDIGSLGEIQEFIDKQKHSSKTQIISSVKFLIIPYKFLHNF